MAYIPPYNIMHYNNASRCPGADSYKVSHQPQLKHSIILNLCKSQLILSSFKRKYLCLLLPHTSLTRQEQPLSLATQSRYERSHRKHTHGAVMQTVQTEYQQSQGANRNCVSHSVERWVRLMTYTGLRRMGPFLASAHQLTISGCGVSYAP